MLVGGGTPTKGEKKHERLMKEFCSCTLGGDSLTFQVDSIIIHSTSRHGGYSLGYHSSLASLSSFAFSLSY